MPDTNSERGRILVLARTLTVLICLSFVAIGELAAEDGKLPVDPNTQVYSRSLGSQIFEIDLGTGIPLFTHPNDSGGVTPMGNFKVGVAAALKWSAFLDKTWAIGADISGLFTQGINTSNFTMVPIGVRVSNFFRLKNVPWEIPIHFTTAFNIMKYKDTTYLGFMLKGGASLYFDATRDWAFGLNVLWWWVPEIYTGAPNGPPASQTKYGHFLEITLSALYNF